VKGTDALIVAGGDGKLHAVRAADGTQLWATQIANIAGGEYVWGSPVVALGSIYVGISSFDDCSDASGKVLRVAVSNGALENSFTTASANCLGGGIWGTPAVDSPRHVVYVATGNPFASGNAEHSCPTPYMLAIVALNAYSLSLISSWQVPASQLNNSDSDFGATPTLFAATINGAARLMLGVVNKNGIYYAFDRTDIAQGPLWTRQIADGGTDPQAGQGSIASSAYDGTRLYVAGGKAGGCGGSVRALDPGTGNQIWFTCLDHPVLGAISAARGDVFTTNGNNMTEFRADNGKPVYRYSGGTTFYSAVTIVPKYLLVGDISGTLYAFTWHDAGVHEM
jgi:outer membrane protein assembly factor BamB